MSGTLPERYVKIGDNRRRPDRLIWASLGRKPHKGETPKIIVEFVSQVIKEEACVAEINFLVRKYMIGEASDAARLHS